MSQSLKKHLAAIKAQLFASHWLARGTHSLLGLLFMLLVLAVLLGGMFGYHLGKRQGYHTAAAAMRDGRGETLTPEAVQSLRLENDILKTETTTLTQERDISLNNVNLLRDEIEALKVSNAQLMQLNGVLSQQVSKDGGIPLGIVAAEVVALPENGYEYRFDVAMVSQDGLAKKLQPNLVLLNATSMVEIPMSPASYDINGVVHIRGRFIMPDAFKPEQIKLTLTADGKKSEQLYDWRVGKVIQDAPSRLADVSVINHHPIVDVTGQIASNSDQ